MEKVSAKKRAANFSSREEANLIALVKKYKDKIECKKSDTNTNKIKLLAWKRVAADFNSVSGEAYRDFQMLRNKYENLKKRSKQKFADEKTFRKKTGGGPSQDFPIDTIDVEIKEIVGMQMTGIRSEFDDDCSDSELKETAIQEIEDFNFQADPSNLCDNFNDDTVESNERRQFLLPKQLTFTEPSCDVSASNDGTTLVDGSNKNFKRKCQNWSKYTPDMLRTEKSTPLKPISKIVSPGKENRSSLKRTRNPLNNKLIEWSATKVELGEVQKAAFIREHELKLKHMQEAHDHTLGLQQAESAAKMKFLKEEHDMKMSILLEEKESLQR